MKKTLPISRWRRFRRSKILVAVAFFLGVFTDQSALTLVQSLAPALIKSMRYAPCNCTRLPARQGIPLIHGGNGSGVLTRPPGDIDMQGPDGYLCRTGEDTGQCYNDAQIMKAISGTVGGLGAAGNVVELLFNPVVGIICAKLGHRKPFLFGSVFQIIGSFMLMLATNEAVLFAGRTTQSLASTFVSISGLLMITEVFTVTRERSQVLALCFASGYPLAAMINNPIGNGGYQLCGSYLPFGLLAAVSIVDGLLRVLADTTPADEVPYEDLDTRANNELCNNMKTGNETTRLDLNEEVSLVSMFGESTDSVKGNGVAKCNGDEKRSVDDGDAQYNRTPKDHDALSNGYAKDHELHNAAKRKGEKDNIEKSKDDKPKDSYLELFTDSHFMALITIEFIMWGSVSGVLATAPNWAINRLGAEQWQLGVVLGVTGTEQLIVNVCVGRFAKPGILWRIILLGHLFLMVYLIVFPFYPTIWWLLLADTMLSLPSSIACGVIPDLLAHAMDGKGTAFTAKAFSMYVASYTLGAAVGPFSAGVLLEYVMSLRAIYLALSGCAVVGALLSVHLRTLRV